MRQIRLRPLSRGKLCQLGPTKKWDSMDKKKLTCCRMKSSQLLVYNCVDSRSIKFFLSQFSIADVVGFMYVNAFGVVLRRRQIFLFCIELCLRIISSSRKNEKRRGVTVVLGKRASHLLDCVSYTRTGNDISFIPPFCKIF